MKKAILLLAVLLAVMLLAGCAARDNNQFPEADTAMQRDPMSVTDQEDEYAEDETGDEGGYDWEDYDPASEEDGGETFADGAVYNDLGQNVYAGATPIPLDPIDMPTATPRPKLTFAYGPVELTLNNQKLKFEAPAGWTANTSAADTVVITDPNTYDGVNATMTVSITSVSSGYKLGDVKTSVRDKLKEIGQYNYNEWTTTDLSARTLLKKDGYYANYRGVYYDGTVVRGRVMVALLDGHRIITLHMMCPGWYNESYMNVVAHFRDTAKLQ